MKKIINIILVIGLVLTFSNIAYAGLDEIKQSDLYPAEYSVSVDINPDKNRDWDVYEIANSLKWNFKEKTQSWIPDSFKLTVDSNPQNDYNLSEVTGGMTWKLK